MNIGIYGGSFNPVHYGHLIPVSFAAEAIGADKIFFVPALTPPHKNSAQLADANHRLEMLKLAISDNPLFEISDIELNKTRSPYTLHLIESFQQRFPDDNISLVIGEDSLCSFDKWFDYKRILDSAHSTVVMVRSGYDLSLVNKNILDKVTILETPFVDISATMIRDRIANNLSIRYLTPDNVVKYITSNSLYC